MRKTAKQAAGEELRAEETGGGGMPGKGGTPGIPGQRSRQGRVTQRVRRG